MNTVDLRLALTYHYICYFPSSPINAHNTHKRFRLLGSINAADSDVSTGTRIRLHVVIAHWANKDHSRQ